MSRSRPRKRAPVEEQRRSESQRKRFTETWSARRRKTPGLVRKLGGSIAGGTARHAPGGPRVQRRRGLRHEMEEIVRGDRHQVPTVWMTCCSARERQRRTLTSTRAGEKSTCGSGRRRCSSAWRTTVRESTSDPAEGDPRGRLLDAAFIGDGSDHHPQFRRSSAAQHQPARHADRYGDWAADCGRPRRPRRRRRLFPSSDRGSGRPSSPARETSSIAGRSDRGASTNSRSPGSMVVLPRGGIVWSPRATTATSAERGRPSSTHRRAGDRVVGGDLEVDQLERAQRADLERRRAHRRRERDDAQLLGDAFERCPLQHGRDQDHEEHDIEDRLGVLDARREDDRAKDDRHRAA